MAIQREEWQRMRQRFRPLAWAVGTLFAAALAGLSWYATVHDMWAVGVGLVSILLVVAAVDAFRRGYLFGGRPWARWVRFGIAASLALASYLGWIPRRDEPREPLDRYVLVYRYDAARDTDTDGNVGCTAAGLVPVASAVRRTANPLADHVSAQLAEALPEVRLLSADLANGVATLVLDDPLNRTGGGSCRVGILRAQVEAAARQLPQVREVRILPEELFQP